MTRALLAVLWPIAIVLSFVATTPLAAAAPSPHAQTLFFDAIFMHARTAGPGVQHAGHRQIVTGVLRDANGRRTGSFSFTCTSTRIRRGHTTESCAAWASTSDGRLGAAGASQPNSITHFWRLTGGTGRYRDASGTVTVRDLGDRESLISASVTTHGRAILRAGRVSRPPANDAFIARANGLCRRAAGELDSLPSFPFTNFDPLRPNPSLLPAVGAFFTGRGDPRAILAALNTGLSGLGEPAGNRGVWRALLGARGHELRVIDEQDRAALAEDVPRFVRSVRESAATFRRIAISATVFGVDRCVL